LRVLPRHTRLQDADSIDLTYSVEELDQGSVYLLPLRSAFRPPAGAVDHPNDTIGNLPVKGRGRWSESSLDGFADREVVRGIGAVAAV